MSNLSKACVSCPWRLSNQGKPHRFGWFTRKNLGRDGYLEAWARAHARYTVWLWTDGKVRLV